MALFKPQSKDDPLEPLRKAERYGILGFLGTGRMSDVSTTFDARLNRIVAAKFLRKDAASRAEHIRSFLNEAKLIAYLDHPGVVPIYDVFAWTDSEPCYTMKLVRGNNLSWDLKTKTKGQFLAIFTKLCETLTYVHDKGVVHLDLNPDNILIGQYGEVLITDWGTARLYDPKPYAEYLKLVRDAPPPPEDDQAHALLASPYMSPEQTLGNRESLTPSSDVFSMGSILYLLMTGHLPFAAETADSLFERIRDFDPPPLHQLSPDIPLRLSQICAKMMHKDPFERYHSLHEVLIDLDRFRDSGEAFQACQYNQGDIIFREGDAGEYAFIILSGAVDVVRIIDGQEKVIDTLTEGEIVGELAIFASEPRTATIRAAAPVTRIRVMGRQAVEHELRKLSPWVGQMVTTLAERFIDLSRRVHT